MKNRFFAFSDEREPPVDQLITDFPHRPNMSTPHLQDLAESDDSTVSGSSVPSDPVNFETGSAAKHDGRWMENDGRYSIDVGSVSLWSLGRCWNLEIMCVNWFDATS